MRAAAEPERSAAGEKTMLILPIMLFVISPGQVPETADPFQDALVAAIHRFAEDSTWPPRAVTFGPFGAACEGSMHPRSSGPTMEPYLRVKSAMTAYHQVGGLKTAHPLATVRKMAQEPAVRDGVTAAHRAL